MYKAGIKFRQAKERRRSEKKPKPVIKKSSALKYKFANLK